MIVTNDILPQERTGLVTGSRVSVLFPKKSAEAGQRTYAKQLANERFWHYYDQTGTWQTEHGNMNEHLAEQHYFDHHGVFGERPKFIVDLENQIGGSPDWVGSDFGIDWKCPTTLQGWLDYLHDGIDDQQYYQAQMYMHLAKKKVWYIGAFLTETLRMIDNGLTYPVPEKSRMIMVKIDFMPGFSEMLLDRVPKIIAMRDQFIEQLKEQFK